VKVIPSADGEISLFQSDLNGTATRTSDNVEMNMKGTQTLKCSMKTGMPISGQVDLKAEMASLASIDDPAISMKFLVHVTRLPVPQPKQPAAKGGKS
jgi:hypothetical protein